MDGLRQLRGVWNQGHSCWPLPLPFRLSRPPPPPAPPRPSFTDDERLLSRLDFRSRPSAAPDAASTGAGEECACHGCRALPRWCCPGAGHRFLHGIACDPLLTTRLAIMGMLAILLIVMTILSWYFTSNHSQRSVTAVAASLRHQLLTQAEQATTGLFKDSNASTVSVASLLNFTGDYSSFATLDAQVKSALFTAYAALPKKMSLSFYGANGMFISYTYSNLNETSFVYSNTSYLYSSSSNQSSVAWNPGENITLSRPWYHSYRQPIDLFTGSPIGDPVSIPSLPFWGLESFNASLHAQQRDSYLSLVLDQAGDLGFQFFSPVRHKSNADAVGVAGIGVSMRQVDELLALVDLRGGDVFLTDHDCRLIAQTRYPVAVAAGQQGAPILPQASASSNPVVAGAARFLEAEKHNCSMLAMQEVLGRKAVIDGVRYFVDTSPLHLGELTLVCVIVIPQKSIQGSADKRSDATLAVLVVLAICAGLVGCFFVILLTKGVSNEMTLKAALIKQLEATKEAETKSSQKSIVFASMSHDLRTPLAAIIGLIDICLCDVAQATELESNLLQMKSCAENLLGILNSVLDMSKIEAGKLQLVEKEFDIVHVLEEVVDIFAVVGMQKGLEVVLEMPDDSIERVSRVQGDEGRVKQLLSNLLSNGVKFTDEGHVVLRVWPKPSSSDVAVDAMKHIEGILGSLVHPFRTWFQGRQKSYNHMRAMYERYASSSTVEFEFEVEDTGKGIPRDRRKAVFDNFVQVDTSTPQSNGGTGLGLGIVRSLVRLMGGDINIVDKGEPGEPGTCFRFNLVFGRVAEPLVLGKVQGMRRYQSKETQVPDRASVQETFGSGGRAAIWSLGTSHGRPMPSGIMADACFTPPLVEGVNVLLAMQGTAGKRVVRRWMERRGLQVWPVNIWEDFVPTLEKIRHEIFYDESGSGFSERFEIASPGIQSLDLWSEEMEIRRRGRDWASHPDTGLPQPVPESEGGRAAVPKCTDRTGARLLVVVDVDMVLEPLSSLATILQGGLSRAEQHALSRVVWLVTSNTPSQTVQTLKDDNVIPCDLCLHKPLHGSRLTSIWELVQELIGRNDGGTRLPQNVEDRSKVGAGDSASDVRLEVQLRQVEPNSSPQMSSLTPGRGMLRMEASLGHSESSIAGGSSGDVVQEISGLQRRLQGSLPEPPTGYRMEPQGPDSESGASKIRPRGSEMMGPPDALAGKLILVAEDNKVLQKLTRTILLRMGAIVECADDGAEAVRRVLANLPKPAGSNSPNDGDVVDIEGQTAGRPYDIVFMDCQMPVLDGYEATMRIREEERFIGWHTPVIALTAHAMAQDESKCIDAGMDFYLTKPLATKALLDVISKVNLSTPRPTSSN